ncbi:hypothetical protein [Streptomyces sp. NBC_01264]|uniref:hypothetical protein n=1 Tax=Streptomyces sp. NBC_01264 TaxID=2903804 RepID=UPI002257B381|nr:hypothetical protein [Streptomyces sp. NBC_01264]MCX4781622.1 hypothetical protein [Streptomyces sp. NBC_01264]
MEVVKSNGDPESLLEHLRLACGDHYYREPTDVEFPNFAAGVYHSLMQFRANGGHYSSRLLRQAALGPDSLLQASGVASEWFRLARMVLFEDCEALGAPGAPGGESHLARVSTPTSEQFVRATPAEIADIRRNEVRLRRKQMEQAAPKQAAPKYPGWSRELDGKAREVLDAVGVSCKDIIVMPDAAASKNVAIAIMLDATAENIQKAIKEMYFPKYAAERGAHIDFDGWCDRVTPGVIVLAASCLDSEDGIGILLHEAGHIVSKNKTECGAVFTLELQYIKQLLGANFARSWFTTNRNASYLRDYPFKFTPGCAEFAESLREIHDETYFYREFKADYERVTKKILPLTPQIRKELGIPEGQDRYPNPGDRIKGNLQLLKAYATTVLKAKDGALKPAGPKKIGMEVLLGDVRWRVVQMPEIGVYVLECMELPEK